MFLKWLEDGLKKPGKNQEGLAAHLGRHPSQITRMKKEGGRRIKDDELAKIAAYLEVETPQVSAMFGSHLVSSYDPDAPDVPIAEEHVPEETPRPNNFPPDGIKELASKSGMGSGQVIESVHVVDGKEIKQQDAVLDEYWRLPPPFVRATLGARIADLLVVECQGDSMEPTLKAHDRVIVNTAHKRPSPDGIYAIRDQLGETIVKRLEMVGSPPRVRVISDNISHKPKEWAMNELEIVGKVVAGLKLF